MDQTTNLDPLPSCAPSSTCSLCRKSPAPVRLPFAVGRQETPPIPREHRILGIGPRRKRFVQRYRWVWYSLRLCRECSRLPSSGELWNAVQNHPGTQDLVRKGYTETRLGRNFGGEEGAVTFSEEPVRNDLQI